MPSSILHKPQSDHSLRCRQPGVMMEALPPIPVAAGAASVNIPPAAICPIGAETTNCTGILFPVIFCHGAVRMVEPGKTSALKLPPIPAATFPASREGFRFRFTQRSISASLFFCLSNKADDSVGRYRVGGWSIAHFNRRYAYRNNVDSRQSERAVCCAVPPSAKFDQ